MTTIILSAHISFYLCIYNMYNLLIISEAFSSVFT